VKKGKEESVRRVLMTCSQHFPPMSIWTKNGTKIITYCNIQTMADGPELVDL
jgi:hypothetical protein